MESVYEQFFIMKLHGGWSLFELYNLPIGLRNWFCDRLAKHFEKQNEEMEKAKSSSK
jgi:hypothetical protein